MPLVELQSPSGQIRQVEFDTDPTEADIEQVALELFGPAQGAVEAGARAVPLGFTKLLTQPVQAAANIQQSIRDIGGKYGGPLGEAVGIGLGQFAPGGYLAKPAGEFAGEVEAEAERLYAPDTESHPIATTVGGAIPQAMGMIGAGATLGPAAPLVLGGLSEAQGGFETAEEIGVTSPEARLGMGLGFGAVGAGFEATGGIGSKTAMTAIEEAAKRGFGATAKLAAKQALSETLEEPATGIGQDALTAIGALSAEDKKHPGRTVTGYDIGQLSMASPEYWQRRGLETIGGAVGGGLFGAVNLANRRQLLDRLAQNQGAAPLTTAAATAKIGQEAKQKAAQPPPIPPTVEGELPFEAPQPPPLPDTDYMEGDLTLEQAQAMADAEQAAIRTETAPESVLPGAAPPEAAPPEVAPELISETIPPEPGAVPQEQLTNAVPPVSSATSVAGQSEGKESVPIPPVAPAAAAPTTGEIQPQTQPPDATQEILQPESLPEEPEGGIAGRETPETGVGDSLLGEAPSQPEGEVAPTPPLNKRGKAISRALQARGVDADLADDIARHVEGQNQDAQMEELRDAAYRAFEAAGGIYAGESPPYSEHYETYLATGLTEQEAQEAVQNAKFWNEQRANEERAHNQRLKKERQYATPKTEQGTGGIESPRITGETESGTIPQTDEPGESRGAPEPAAPPSKRPVAPWVESGLTEPGQTEGDLVADFGIELRAIQQEAGQPAETLFDLPEPQKRNLSQLREAVVAEIDRNEADPRRAELEDDDPAYVALENERRRLDTLLGRIEAKLMPRQEAVPQPTETAEPVSTAEAAPQPREAAKLSKSQIQVLLSRGHQVAPAGPAYAAFRQSLLQSLTGTSVPKSKAGINAVENALFDAYGINRNQSKAAMDDALRAALRAELEGTAEAAQPASQPPPETVESQPPATEGQASAPDIKKPLNDALASLQASGTPAIWLGDVVITPRGKYNVTPEGLLKPIQDLSQRGFERNLEAVEGGAESEGVLWAANKAAKELMAQMAAVRAAVRAADAQAIADKKAQDELKAQEAEERHRAYAAEVDAIELPRPKTQTIELQEVDRDGKPSGKRPQEAMVYGPFAFYKNSKYRGRSTYYPEPKYIITHVPTGRMAMGAAPIHSMADARRYIKTLLHTAIDWNKTSFGNDDINKALQSTSAFIQGTFPEWWSPQTKASAEITPPATEEPGESGDAGRKPKLSIGESTALATEDRGEPISLKEAQDHLTSMGVKAPKVTVIHEPSLDWRGRYNEDGSITLNAGRIHSLEELDHVLFNHEAVHDAIENDPEVRKAAANLEAVLTKAEFDEITEIVRPYEPGERPDERMVEAVHILARGRPDLQSAWNRFVEAVRQAIAKFLGIKLPSRKEAELVAAQILARGRQRTMEGELGREGGAPLFSRYEDSPESDAAIAGFPRQREVKPETAEQEDVLKGWKDSEAKYAATATGGKVTNEMSYKQIVAQAKEWLGQYDSLLTALDAAKDIANTPLRLEVVDQILAEAWKKSVSSDPYRKAEGLKAIELAAIARQAIGEEWGQGGAFRRESYKTKAGMFAVLTTRGILKRRQEARIKGKIRGGTAAAVQAVQGAVNRVDRVLGGLIKGTPAPTERPQSTEGRPVLTKSDEELLDAELAEAADIDIDALEKAIAIADGILNKLAFTHKDPLEWGKKKPSRIHPIKALYNEHLGNPMEEQEFVDGMVALDVPEDLARKLFNAASMEIAARKRIKQTTANLQAEEMAEKTARRLVYRISKLHRQSGYLRTGKNLDTISKAFRDQVNSPLTWDEFRNRLQTLKVTEPTAAALFHVAQRESAAQAEMKRATLFKSLTSDAGMEKLLNQIKRKVAPDAVFWRDILADLPQQRQDQRQAEIFNRLRKHEAFRDLTLPEQLALARAMDRAWQKQRQKLFKSYLDKYDAFRARKKQDAVKLRETAPELFRLINLGMFGAETFRDLLAHKLGIGYMTDKEAAEIAQMAEKIQDMPHGYLRTVESMKLIRKMRQVAHATMGEILDSYWTSSVLSSPRTWTGILMSSVMSFVETATLAAKVGVMGKPTLAVKTMSDIFSELLPTIAEATMSVFTGDRTGTVGIEDHINAYLRDPANVRPPVSMARELMDRGGAAKAPAVVIGTSSRIMSALDQFASTATRKAQLRLAADLRGLSFPSREDIAVMRQRANDELFGGREPSTPAEWAQRRAYVRDAMDQTFPKEVTNSVNVIARSMALQNDPTGAVGIVYDAVNHMFSNMQRMAREAAVETREKALEKDEITVEDKLKVVSMDALSVLATIAKGLAGAKFIRALTNMVNYGASYMPGTALPVVRNALLSTLKKDDTRSMNTPEGRAVIQARNLVGLMAIGTLYTLLEYVANGGGADDDDLIGIEGDWRSLTPQQVNNRRGTKAIPLSIWWTDSKGVRHYHSYKNIPGLSMIFGAIGNAMDKARYHPDEWKAMSRSERLGYASLAIFSAPFQTSMASAWTSGGKPIREDFSTLTSLRDMIVNYAGGLFPAALKDIDYITDPVYRKPEGAAERFMFHIPFVRRFVGTEKTGVFGDKVELNRWPWGREFSMSNENAAYDNLQKLNRHGLFINPPGERKKQLISGGSREMTEDERQKYEQNVAEGYARYVLRQTDRLLKLPPEKAQATLNSDLDKIRDRAAGGPSSRRR